MLIPVTESDSSGGPLVSIWSVSRACGVVTVTVCVTLVGAECSVLSLKPHPSRTQLGQDELEHFRLQVVTMSPSHFTRRYAIVDLTCRLEFW